MNLLDVAVKYCQQNKPTERPKNTTYNVVPRAAALSVNVSVKILFLLFLILKSLPEVPVIPLSFKSSSSGDEKKIVMFFMVLNKHFL